MFVLTFFRSEVAQNQFLWLHNLNVIDADVLKSSPLCTDRNLLQNFLRNLLDAGVVCIFQVDKSCCRRWRYFSLTAKL